MIIADNMGQFTVFVDITGKYELEILVVGKGLKKAFTYTACACKEVKERNWFFTIEKIVSLCHCIK